MEQGKRYAQSNRGFFVKDSSGPWLWDPDKELISRDVAIMEKETGVLIGELRDLLEEWRKNISEERSISGAATSLCCNELDDLIEGWEGGNDEKR